MEIGGVLTGVDEGSTSVGLPTEVMVPKLNRFHQISDPDELVPSAESSSVSDLPSIEAAVVAVVVVMESISAGLRYGSEPATERLEASMSNELVTITVTDSFRDSILLLSRSGRNSI